jgi:hypothetical protein
MSSRPPELLQARREWLDAQLRQLEPKSYSELAALPRRTPLAAPPHLSSLKFYISRKQGENGGVEVSVREYTRFLLIFEGSVGPSFEKLPDGTLIRENLEHDEVD